MTTRTTILGLLLLAVATAGAQEPEEVSLPFSMPTPEGWREETIPFPLGFAPELEYEGVEVLRFAPGMFDADADDYWTYAFVWWVSLEPNLEAKTIERDLEAYFRGLTGAVAESRDFDAGDPEYRANLAAVGPSEKGRRFEGSVRTFDPFVTRAAVTLNARIEIWSCGENRVAFFEFSPRSREHEIWKTLEAIRRGFECGEAARSGDSRRPAPTDP